MALSTPADLRIDHPGDGDWVMERVFGVFTPGSDHVIARAQDGRVLGGFVLSTYLGAAMSVHMAGADPGWCSRTLMWMVFHYAFIQLGVRKLIAPVASTNTLALEMDLRAGWRLEAVVRDVYPDGDMMLLGMTREHCPWLRVKPHGWVSGDVARARKVA